MHIYEAGIIIGGVPTITVNYINPSEHEVDLIHKCALMSCILNFAEILISPIESFESNRFNFAFRRDKIQSFDSDETDIHAYFILNRHKEFNTNVKTKILPVLDLIIDEFKSRYTYRDFSYSTQFLEFRAIIDKIIGISSKTLEQKVEMLFLKNQIITKD